MSVIANTLFQQLKRWLYIWTSPDGQYHTVKAMIFPVIMSNSQMWELDHKEGWEPKSWFFWIVVLEKTLQSPLDWGLKEIKAVNSEGNQPWIFIGRTDAEFEAPVLWPPDMRVNSKEKTLMLEKIESRRRRGWQRMRRLDGIINSLDIRVWANSKRYWRTGKPGML